MSGVIGEENTGKKFKSRVKAMENTVKNLERNLKESNQTNNQVIMTLNSEKIKYQGLSHQLEEALKENKELLNILQQKSGDQDLSRPNSQVDLSSSCSTMSIVHLQYKYEELLSSHYGLLKLLEMKSGEIKKMQEENGRLKEDMEQMKENVAQSAEKIQKLQRRIERIKNRKDRKIEKLKAHRDTLHLVHNQLVSLLHNQCMEKDDLLMEEIKTSPSEKALLLQEIRKNNMLAYENFQLHQKLEYLRSLLEFDNNKLEKLLS